MQGDVTTATPASCQGLQGLGGDLAVLIGCRMIRVLRVVLRLSQVACSLQMDVMLVP